MSKATIVGVGAIVLGVAVLAGMLVGGAVWWWQEKNVQSLERQVRQLEAEDEIVQKAVPLSDWLDDKQAAGEQGVTGPKKSAEQAVIHVLEGGEAAGLEEWLADEVMYTMFETSCCGVIAKAEVLDRLGGMDSIQDYNFSPVQDVVTDIRRSSPDLSNYELGVSEDERVLGFRLNEVDKVDAIWLAVVQQSAD